MVYFLSIVCFLLFGLYYFYVVLWLRPERLREKLKKQGIAGPKPSLFYGNLKEMKKIVAEEKSRRGDRAIGFGEDYCSVLFPYFKRWMQEYGPLFVYSRGSYQLLHIGQPDLLKQLGLYKSLGLGRPMFVQKERKALLGKGLLTANGELWAHERKVIAPELFMNKVKGMVGLVVEASFALIESWENIIQKRRGMGEIVVDDYLRNFSADVISRACFGSNYLEGKDIFLKLRQLQFAMSKRGLDIGIPSLRYLPTKSNRAIWRLDQEVRLLILEVVRQRKEGGTHQNDLLQIIIQGADAVDPKISDDFIIDNCKSIYFAGHETTATSATWCLLLLAAHPEWQARARAEVAEVLSGQPPQADMLSKMKTLTMVIQETLRLIPPVSFISREAFTDLKLGDLHIPEGMTIWIPISMLHHDPIVWGPDSNEFNPARFTNGVLGASKSPHMYIPFGIGPRTCAGQNLAMVELKVILSLLLSKFHFCLSPKYVHSPAFRLTIEPEFGVPLIIKRVESDL